MSNQFLSEKEVLNARTKFGIVSARIAEKFVFKFHSFLELCRTEFAAVLNKNFY